MSTHPYLPLYVDDYEAATAHLTAEEDGIYSRLLRLCWRTPGCSLPNDPAWIARKVRVSAEDYDRVVRLVIEDFFKVVRGRLVQKRLKAEYETISRKKAARVKAGKRGGDAKALKNNENDPSNASDLPAHARAFPEPEPEPDKIHEPSVHCRPKADPLPVQEAFDEWNAIATRRRLPIAKSLTPSRRKQIKARLADGGIAGWREALRAVEDSPLCLGENDRGWRADLDFVCQPKSFAKLREGSYAAPGKSGQGPPSAEMTALRARHEALLAGIPAHAAAS